MNEPNGNGVERFMMECRKVLRINLGIHRKYSDMNHRDLSFGWSQEEIAGRANRSGALLQLGLKAGLSPARVAEMKDQLLAEIVESGLNRSDQDGKE